MWKKEFMEAEGQHVVCSLLLGENANCENYKAFWKRNFSLFLRKDLQSEWNIFQQDNHGHTL